MFFLRKLRYLDQGRNTRVPNPGVFYSPLCYSSGPDRWFAETGEFPSNTEDGVTTDASTNILQGDQVAVFGVDLCRDSHFQILPTNSADVPRTRSLPASNNAGMPYTRMAMVLSGFRPIVNFTPPFQNIVFGDTLTLKWLMNYLISAATLSGLAEVLSNIISSIEMKR